MTKNRTRTPVYLDPGMHPGLEVKGLSRFSMCKYSTEMAQNNSHADSGKIVFLYYYHVYGSRPVGLFRPHGA